MSKTKETLYEILGVSQNASLREIKIQYRNKIKEYHPDVNPSTMNETCHKIVCKINEAYSILRNPDLRELYDEGIADEKEDKETSSPMPQEKSACDTQEKVYKESYKVNPEKYKYYNLIDFDEIEQEEFIYWIEAFSHEYIKALYNYYRIHGKNTDSILESIYNGFDNIIDCEKKYRIKKTSHKL